MNGSDHVAVEAFSRLVGRQTSLSSGKGARAVERPVCGLMVRGLDSERKRGRRWKDGVFVCLLIGAWQIAHRPPGAFPVAADYR
jgi:hypothetical protein